MKTDRRPLRKRNLIDAHCENTFAKTEHNAKTKSDKRSLRERICENRIQMQKRNLIDAQCKIALHLSLAKTSGVVRSHEISRDLMTYHDISRHITRLHDENQFSSYLKAKFLFLSHVNCQSPWVTYVYQSNNNSGNRILPLDGPTSPSDIHTYQVG
jgi:hypothetical protein